MKQGLQFYNFMKKKYHVSCQKSVKMADSLKTYQLLVRINVSSFNSEWMLLKVETNAWQTYTVGIMCHHSRNTQGLCYKMCKYWYTSKYANIDIFQKTERKD